MYRTRKVDSWKLQKEEQRTAITFLSKEFFNVASMATEMEKE